MGCDWVSGDEQMESSVRIANEAVHVCSLHLRTIMMRHGTERDHLETSSWHTFAQAGKRASCADIENMLLQAFPSARVMIEMCQHGFLCRFAGHVFGRSGHVCNQIAIQYKLGS